MSIEFGFRRAVEEGSACDYQVKLVVKRTEHVMAGKKNLSELSSPLPRSLAVYILGDKAVRSSSSHRLKGCDVER